MELSLEPFKKFIFKSNNDSSFDGSWFNSSWTSIWEGMDTFFGDARYVDDEGNATYEFEIPGFNKNNTNVSIANGTLVISGKRETNNKSHAGVKEIYKRLVLGYSPPDIDAKIKDGILYLTLKNPESEKVNVELK